MRAAARVVIILSVLGVLLFGVSLVSRAPTLPQVLAPQPPRLVRIKTREPELGSQAVYIGRLKTGEVLFAQNPEARLPIASLTKLMTALLLAESADGLDFVPFSASAKTVGEADDKRSAMAAGDELKVEDVFTLLLASSDNDAAYAAAEFAALALDPELAARPLADRVTAFVGEMNARAQELELADTHFANPAGRDDPENYATARDLIQLAGYITQRHPELWAASRVRETFVFSANGKRIGVVNTNPLLSEFPAIFGSKTGFDDQARGALLLLYQFRRNDLVAIVLLRSPDRFADGRAAIRWLESSFQLETLNPKL